MLQWLRPSELKACFSSRLKQVAPEQAYVNADFYCGDAVQNLPNRDGLTREQPKDSGEQDLTKHISEYQRKFKASRAAIGIALALNLHPVNNSAMGAEDAFKKCTLRYVLSPVAIALAGHGATLRHLFAREEAQVLQHANMFLICFASWLCIEDRDRPERVAIAGKDRRARVVANLDGALVALDHGILAEAVVILGVQHDEDTGLANRMGTKR
ncbi:hypothetical protein PsorP6_016128 [Peronosclerospora sorghi]|uniref:Uncharacterized protein n=1 Tax=Peronosclerospora sorghi TaxID=230839 RepID=A0ACC0VQH3_9STRA|nr:hypothetical protein PsorP6_016128 [Peronosclerospora sorghi]